VTGLLIDPNLEDADGFYAALIDAHRDLSEHESGILNARLVLLLANHIGRRAALIEALARARRSVMEERDEQVD
jgi:Protein of unknown function (DUF2783)